jgi:hypothetical protein
MEAFTETRSDSGSRRCYCARFFLGIPKGLPVSIPLEWAPKLPLLNDSGIAAAHGAAFFSPFPDNGHIPQLPPADRYHFIPRRNPC